MKQVSTKEKVFIQTNTIKYFIRAPKIKTLTLVNINERHCVISSYFPNSALLSIFHCLVRNNREWFNKSPFFHQLKKQSI